MPTPKFQPTSDQRKLVEMLCAHGVPQLEIARQIKDAKGKPITDRTLRKYFKDEIASSATKANAKVMETLYRMATRGTYQYQASTIFWAKTRCGLKETSVSELTGKDGAPLPTTVLKVNFVKAKRPNAGS